MLRILSIGITPDLQKSIKFKVKVLNGVGIGTLLLLSAYAIIHFIEGDDYTYLIPHIFYVLTGVSILTFNYLKKYTFADYSLNILFPISFMASGIQLGGQLDIEYFLYLTGVGAAFFSTSINKKIKWRILILNLLLFIALKIYIIYKPTGFLSINPDLSPYFNLFNGIVIFLLLYVIVSVIFNRNIRLLQKLKNLTENQEAIIQERTKEIERKSEDLQRYVYELERFSYISAHDLREPLRTIKGFSQLLEKDIETGNTDNLKEYSRYIKSGVDRLDVLTNDIVRYTEIESLVKEKEIVHLTKIIHKIITQIDKKIDIDLPENLPHIEINTQLCYFLFENIIHNAIEYCNKPIPKISIQVNQDDNFHHFSIQDNGKGIPEEYHKLVFEMFKRLQNDFSKEGSGIGLAICKKIVQAHKGKIWMESKVGVGSTVHFLFPKIETIN